MKRFAAWFVVAVIWMMVASALWIDRSVASLMVFIAFGIPLFVWAICQR